MNNKHTEVDEREEVFDLIVLCSEAIGALSYHNKSSAKEYKEKLEAITKEVLEDKE